MRLREIVFFALVFAGLMTSAATELTPQQQFMQQFQTSRVAFPKEDSPYNASNEGRYSWPLRILLQKILAWTPTGEGRPMSAKCSPELWGSRLQDTRIRDSVLLQGALIQKYFKDCESEIETGWNNDAVNLMKMMTMKLEPQAHPFMQRVVFSLPGNIKLKGLLGLKGDYKKRPLIVIRLGIFANVEEFMPERAWVMMLFEQSPFNVLLLENMSGTDFIANNTRFSFGGYDEAIQNILVAQILKDPNEPLSRLIESLHLFGVSLGGHGVLYGSLLNELNSPKGRPLYQSFMGMCPVVNLEKTLKNLTLEKPFSWVAEFWAGKRLAALPEKVKSLEDTSRFSLLETSVGEVARTYQGGLSYVSAIKLPEGLRDGPDFWQLNDFWKYYKNVRQPVMIFGNHTDLLVPFKLNAQELQKKEIKIASNNVSVVDFGHGIHCTLPVPYDWKAISTLLQSYVLSHAPGFKTQNQILEMEVGDETNQDFYKSSVKVSYKIEPPEAKESFIRIAVEFENEKGNNEDLKMSLPLSQFDFRFLNNELTPSEQAMIHRWANQNLKVKLVSKEGKSLLQISWPLAL